MYAVWRRLQDSQAAPWRNKKSERSVKREWKSYRDCCAITPSARSSGQGYWSSPLLGCGFSQRAQPTKDIVAVQLRKSTSR